MSNTIFEMIGSDGILLEEGHLNDVVKKISQSYGSGERDDHSKFFKNNWMPFAMAALIGFRENMSRPLRTPIKKDVFKYTNINSGSRQLFELLILNVVNIVGHEVLKDKSKIKKTIEEHANGGFDYLRDQINDDSKFLADIDYLDFLRKYQEIK